MAEQGNEVAVFQFPPLFYLYADGSVRRTEPPPPQEPRPQDPLTFKDLTFNADRGLWARLYLPNPPPAAHKKLPVALFFHGGCFVMASPAWDHPLCSALASRSGFLWIACSYRLAPEHRLPAALEDCVAALDWLRSQAELGASADPWLAQYADFSKCFLVGESVGSNMILHGFMQYSQPSASSWLPLCVRGLVYLHPGFMRGTGQRTDEEKAIAPDVLFNWQVGDACFDLALPRGLSSKDDHPFYNPLPKLAACAGEVVFPDSLIAVAEKDCLRFMGLEFGKALKDYMGCNVVELTSRGVGHCFYFAQPESEQANLLFNNIVSFLHAQC